MIADRIVRYHKLFEMPTTYERCGHAIWIRSVPSANVPYKHPKDKASAGTKGPLHQAGHLITGIDAQARLGPVARVVSGRRRAKARTSTNIMIAQSPFWV